MTRWKAAGIHLAISAAVVGTLVALLLLTWYPPAFVRMGKLGTLVALIGGIDSPGGAGLGGFLVGVLENVLGAYVVGNELKLVVALVLIDHALRHRAQCGDVGPVKPRIPGAVME